MVDNFCDKHYSEEKIFVGGKIEAPAKSLKSHVNTREAKLEVLKRNLNRTNSIYHAHGQPSKELNEALEELFHVVHSVLVDREHRNRSRNPLKKILSLIWR